MEAAKEALNTIKPSDIGIVKSMNNPPIGVKVVMGAVCVLKGIAPDKIADPNKPGSKVNSDIFSDNFRKFLLILNLTC